MIIVWMFHEATWILLIDNDRLSGKRENIDKKIHGKKSISYWYDSDTELKLNLSRYLHWIYNSENYFQIICNICSIKNVFALMFLPLFQCIRLHWYGWLQSKIHQTFSQTVGKSIDLTIRIHFRKWFKRLFAACATS